MDNHRPMDSILIADHIIKKKSKTVQFLRSVVESRINGLTFYLLEMAVPSFTCQEYYRPFVDVHLEVVQVLLKAASTAEEW